MPSRLEITETRATSIQSPSNVYPTAAALRWQDPKLSDREAKAICGG
jgi:hypothetical protein